jgi:hypothetical protein
MILRLLGLAALAGSATALAYGNAVPLAILAIALMISAPVLDWFGYHPQRNNRGWRR